MTSWLLYINTASLIYLSIFALCFIIIFFISIFIKNRNKSNNNYREENSVDIKENTNVKEFNYNNKEKKSVSILVPTINEGEMIIDSLNSLLYQDYLGNVDIYVLVNNLSDNSLVYLEKKYKVKFNKEKAGDIINFFNKDNFNVSLVLTGFDSKKEKLNYIIPKLNSDYIGIIDVDHRPSSNWVNSSIDIFNIKDVSYVQTKRAPLDLSTLPQIWDSVQNHGGNELLNLVLSKTNKNVFFTGTAAIFKGNVLKDNSFSSSITEDTDLSYRLLFNGYRSAYNNIACSYEEVAPSLKAYISRRRRWSAGHSKVFLRNLKSIFTKKNNFSFRLLSFFHGQFYFIPIAVFIILTVYGIHYFDQLALNQRIVVLVLSLFISFIFSYFFKSSKRTTLFEFLASFLWIWPQITVLSILIFHLHSWDGYYYILNFPLENEFSLWRIFLYFIPLLVITMAFIKIKETRRWRNVLYYITYPISLFFDIYSGFLGFIDLIFSKSKWTKIKRSNTYSYSLVDRNVSKNFSSKKTNNANKKRWFYIILFGFITIFIVNDLLAINNCGQIEKFLWKPLVFRPNSSLIVKTNISKEIVNNRLIVKGIADISELPNNYYVKTYLDNELVYEGDVENKSFQFFKDEYDLGFEKHSLYINFNTKSENSRNICYREIDFTTTKKEIKENSLYLNGEKFLIKGIIPSFLGNNIDLEIDEAFSQFKKVGFNAIRFYHGATDNLIDKSAKHDLMIIDQPDESTWDNFNISNDFQVNNFIKRYKKTIEKSSKSPYWLFTGIGNEWELKAREENFMPKIFNIIRKAKNEIKNFPTSYSSYFTFIDFPVDILGINMLDNGDVYWQKAVDKLEENNKTYYASEFGGFTAFLEDTVPEIRYNRILKEWDILLNSGALGANFYQSHDNWAQSLPGGYNDPNKAEHFDDVRGFWDEKNLEKIEIGALKKVLSDIEIINNFQNQEIKNCKNDFVFKFKNKREYNLKDVSLNVLDENFYIGDFKPLEEKEFVLPENINKEDKLDLKFLYTTHSGLKNYSLIPFQIPCLGSDVKIINNDVVIKNETSDLIEGRLISSNKLEFVIPEKWDRFSLNGIEYENNKKYYSKVVNGPYYDVIDLMYSKDKINWQKFKKDSDINGGQYYFKFRWPEITNYNTYLIIEGVGDEKISFDLKYGKKDIKTHSYRENVIHISSLGNIKEGDEIIFSVNRNMIKYVDKRGARNFNVPLVYEDDLIVDFKEPKVFSVTDFQIKKID